MPQIPEKEKELPLAAEPEITDETPLEEPAAASVETPSDLSDTDAALERFLERSSKEEKAEKQEKKPNHRLSRSMIVLLSAVIAVALLVAVVIFINSLPDPEGTATEGIFDEAEIATEVDDRGVHQVEIPVDEAGEIKQNGQGALVEYVPSDIVRIDVENTSGSFSVTAETPEGEATVYTLVGYEGFPLQEGTADAVANDAAAVNFLSVASLDGDPADFGLTDPRAVVNVTYTDDTRCVIRVGAEAAAQAGTYITFGDSGTIYLVSNDAVDSFLCGVLEFISREITESAEDLETAQPLSIELSGSRYSDPITLEKIDDEAISADYELTAPYRMFANSAETLDVTGSIRSLYADSVVYVNPSSGQLADCGLSEPYAIVTAAYPDSGSITLHASAPADDGTVHLYHPQKKIVYTISLASIRWANTSVDALRPAVVLPFNREAVTDITATVDGKNTSFKVHTTTKSVENTEGGAEDVTTTEAFCGEKRLDSDSFLLFMQSIADLSLNGSVDSAGSKVVLDLRIGYSTGRPADRIMIYDSGAGKYPVALNNVLMGTVSRREVNTLIGYVSDLKKGKTLFSE